ncbi:hypothetical protein [Kineococcus siccus]|uniref:hypothetical protein n=1 Tax=Kineococcus siccus TaxID=2696567 RepID=UPI0014121BDE|nr:hypothetical protein [Kineococcus siccus]
MAGLFSKVTRFLSTPEGKRLTSEATRRAQAMAKDPATRQKIADARRRLGKPR